MLITSNSGNSPRTFSKPRLEAKIERSLILATGNAGLDHIIRQ